MSPDEQPTGGTMPSYIVGRRAVEGWRSKAERKKSIRYGTPDEEGAEDRKRGAYKKYRAVDVPEEKTDWQSIPVEEFELDCGLAITILATKLGTYTERNRQLTLEFIAELRKLVVEREGARVAFRITGKGTFAQSTFLRLEHRMGDGEVREHVIPGGFRDMCKKAITWKPPQNNDAFFPKRRKPDWKRRILYD